MEGLASKKTDRTKNSNMVQTVSLSSRTSKRKKQPAQRKILRMGRILSVPFWAHNARYLMTLANSSWTQIPRSLNASGKNSQQKGKTLTQTRRNFQINVFLSSFSIEANSKKNQEKKRQRSFKFVLHLDFFWKTNQRKDWLFVPKTRRCLDCFFFISPFKRKKQPAQRKILRIGRILSVPFWIQNARHLQIPEVDACANGDNPRNTCTCIIILHVYIYI